MIWFWLEVSNHLLKDLCTCKQMKALVNFEDFITPSVLVDCNITGKFTSHRQSLKKNVI